MRTVLRNVLVDLSEEIVFRKIRLWNVYLEFTLKVPGILSQLKQCFTEKKTTEFIFIMQLSIRSACYNNVHTREDVGSTKCFSSLNHKLKK